MKISIFNHSKRVEDVSLELIVKAINRQLKYHAAPLWEIKPPVVDIGGTGVQLHLFDNADVAGALGYHDETPDGKPYGKVFIDIILNNGTLLTGGLSVSSVIDHEVLEMVLDMNVNVWATNFHGKAYAYEACDPVESDTYVTKIGTQRVSLSNFITRAWFDSNSAETRFDYMRKLSGPHQMSPGGYVIVEQEGKITQEFAAITTYSAAKKRETKTHPASRTYKRLNK